MKTPVTRLADCQSLLVSQINDTLTNFADHCEFSHDAINRHLRRDRVTPRTLWDNVRGDVVATSHGYLLFDATVLDKNDSHQIELVRRQWSGNEKAVIKGIGVVTCVDVNPETDTFWLIDFRLYDPDGDGKSKLDHVHEMLSNAVHQKRLPFQAVLMDSWYAAKTLMLFIESLGKLYDCPLKSHRQVDDSAATSPDRRIDALDWSPQELAMGKTIKVKDVPKDHKLRLFRVEVSTHRTDWVVTNDLAQDSTQAAHQVCGFRWKIEQMHREGKQTTGLEDGQCRTARIQRNHIACAFLVWARLKHLAAETGRTVYQLKHGLLDDDLTQQLKNPSLRMAFA